MTISCLSMYVVVHGPHPPLVLSPNSFHTRYALSHTPTDETYFKFRYKAIQPTKPTICSMRHILHIRQKTEDQILKPAPRQLLALRFKGRECVVCNLRTRLIKVSYSTATYKLERRYPDPVGRGLVFLSLESYVVLE